MQYISARASENGFVSDRQLFLAPAPTRGVSTFHGRLFIQFSQPQTGHDGKAPSLSMSTLLNLSSCLLTLSKDGWLYIFSHGFLFAGDGLAYESMRLTASILLSLTGEPFEIEVTGGRQSGQAFLVRPGVWRCLDAAHTPIVSIGLCPTHEVFRAFSTNPEPVDAWPLPRALFADCDERFHAARAGLLTPGEAAATASLVMERTRCTRAEAPALDPRIERVRELLDEAPNTSMKRLADEVDLSYHRLSHLFSQQMGITLRMYAISRKLDLAAMMAGQGLNLTQIAVSSGFADSAHFSRTWMRSIGSPPSQMLSSQRVGIRSAYGPG